MIIALVKPAINDSRLTFAWRLSRPMCSKADFVYTREWAPDGPARCQLACDTERPPDSRPGCKPWFDTSVRVIKTERGWIQFKKLIHPLTAANVMFCVYKWDTTMNHHSNPKYNNTSFISRQNVVVSKIRHILSKIYLAIKCPIVYDNQPGPILNTCFQTSDIFSHYHLIEIRMILGVTKNNHHYRQAN